MNQNQVRLLILAIVILSVAGLGLFFQSDLKRLMTGKQNTDSVSKENSSIGPKVTLAVSRQIRAATFVPDYNISILNERDLVSEFELLHVFGRTYVTDNKQTTGSKPLEEIQIAIRSGQAPEGRQPTYGDFTYVNFAEGLIQVNFLLTSNQLDDEEIGDILLQEMIGAVYKSVYKESTDQEIEDEIKKAYDNLKEKNNEYIVVSKK